MPPYPGSGTRQVPGDSLREPTLTDDRLSSEVHINELSVRLRLDVADPERPVLAFLTLSDEIGDAPPAESGRDVFITRSEPDLRQRRIS